MDQIDKIIAYEQGELSEVNSVILFAELIKTGQAWSLQGHYGRTAKHLIDNEVISKEGEILVDLD
tara:strand:- start:32176 stop:32370 length:195 start_codon:yes stop_codon:yes gene_type:complete